MAIELKVDRFEPEHLGKLNFYLEALDRDVRKPHENPSPLGAATLIIPQLEAALAAKNPTIVGKPVADMNDGALERIADTETPAGEKARAELEARDAADEPDIGAMFDNAVDELFGDAPIVATGTGGLLPGAGAAGVPGARPSVMMAGAAATAPVGGTTRSTWPTSITLGLSRVFQRTISRQGWFTSVAIFMIVSPARTV